MFAVVLFGVSLLIILFFSFRSWRTVDLVNIPLGDFGPYFLAMTYRSGVWIDVHDSVGGYDGGDATTEVSWTDDGIHAIPFQEEFDASCMTDFHFKFRRGGSKPVEIVFPLWILVVPPFVLLIFEFTRHSSNRQRPSPNKPE